MKKFSVKNEEEAMSLTFLLNQNMGVDDDRTGDKNQLLLRLNDGFVTFCQNCILRKIAQKMRFDGI